MVQDTSAFLHVEDGAIVDARGTPVRLRGVNLGNWLLLEGYMLGGPNEPERRIRESLAAAIGTAGARRFFEAFQDRYIIRRDLEQIRRWGFNVVRVPLNCGVFLPSKVGALYGRRGWERLDWLVRQCRRLGLYVLLDLHAAPGAQNADWHSDSDGTARLWTVAANQEAVVRFWRQVAERFRDEPAIAGYDLLNEPNTDRKPLLAQLYRRCTEAIRRAGDRHLVFIEGAVWSTDFLGIDTLDDDQVVYSPHFYNPFQYTFHFNLGARYPGPVEGKRWDRAALRGELLRYAALANKRRRPVLIGEFGIQSDGTGRRGESRWVRDVVELCQTLGFHWTYWAYKTFAGHTFPNGLLQHPDNTPWLRREGPTSGWENFGRASSSERRAILRAAGSSAFVPDKSILDALRRVL